MGHAIAIVGMACRYPDARSPGELWENALAQRRAFRRIPAERLNLNDYVSSDRQSPDRTYSTEGAFIEGYEFDRARFRVPGETYRAADPAHWLALDVAAAALEDAGFAEGDGLPRETTGVFLGNTLTGEFSRANTMRLRWPYVRRVVRQILEDDACPMERQRELLTQMEALYKKPFPPVGAESLAGGLSNTIAGRICNHFDLKGGGYTLDGACASSLLAVINACSSLAAGDLEVAIAGGVDLSTDPFELVGFAKTGALAADAMRVYDVRSAGFWPGEGCGVVVLMRYEDALLKRRRVYAVIRGWGVSSDGSGGITRPEVEGQLIALRRAYARAGYGADTVAYFEGHGTGTAVGDATELQALARARRDAAETLAEGMKVSPAVVSSVKAIIGHTKAAAGIAGLIKATMALDAQILPPTVGCDDPREELNGDKSSLRALKQAELFSPNSSLRAGVSAMGFGGINTHVTLEAPRDDRRQSLTSRERALLTTTQDAELFLFNAGNVDQLEQQIERVLAYAGRLSRSELTDLAVRLSATLRPLRVRAAVVASSAAELSARLEALKSHARSGGGAARSIDPQGGIFFGVDSSSIRIGFLFPGQGSPSYRDGGLWARRFNFLEDLYAYTKQEWHGDGVSTEVAQPVIIASSVAALRVLARLGITATVGVGHSLGEFTALHWAGSLDESALLRIARARGRAMAEVEGPQGAMLSVAADRQAVEEILHGERVVIAGLNSPVQTVLSGKAAEIDVVARRAEARGLRTTLLRVSHAFHSPLVRSAGTRLSTHLEREEFGPVQREVFSTVTGQHLNGNTDFRALLREQVTSPVRFMEAVNAAGDAGVDLWIEVGPGQTLCGLVGQFRKEPAVALDAGGSSVRGLLHAVAACFCLGARVAHDELFADRFARPFDLDWRPRFFVNPCELAPTDDAIIVSPDESSDIRATNELPVESETHTPLEVVRQLVAERLELPIATIENESRLLDDLHLNSISVAQLVAEAARHLDLPPPATPTNYANATLSEIASALETAARTGGLNSNSAADANPPGVDEWVREFSVVFVERPLPRREHPHVNTLKAQSGAPHVSAPQAQSEAPHVSAPEAQSEAPHVSAPQARSEAPHVSAPKAQSEASHVSAPKARSEGSQGQVRSAAQHAAPGNQTKDDQPGTGDRHAAPTTSVGPSGPKQSSTLIQGQRAFALAPGYHHAAPPARLSASPPEAPSENSWPKTPCENLQRETPCENSRWETPSENSRRETPSEDSRWKTPSENSRWETPCENLQPETPPENSRWEDASETGDWSILGPPEHPLRSALQRSFALSRVGRGVVVLLSPEPDESHVGLLLDGARAALKGGDDFRFVLVQHSGFESGAASFARTLHLEANNLNTCVVDVTFEHPKAAAWVVAEALAARGYTEARYSADGRRYEPVLRPLELDVPRHTDETDEADEANAGELPLTTNDVLIVTGGARGITAECALRLARDSGARLAIFGLSQPAADDEIVSNLARMKAARINFRYYSVDVTDTAATRSAVREVEKDLGPVTAILHGAARNVPCLIENLDAETFSETLAPKIRGAQNLLAAIDPDRLRLFITFSSIIARTGLPGEAHYGLANEWLTRLTKKWQAAHPHCRCLAVEWSVWSGVGMGARLGTVDELARQGITPIPVEKGLDALRRLLCRKSPNVSAVVMGRLRDMPTLKVEQPELPFLRFLEKPRVYYPKIELVVDAELSTATDPYLDDHIFRGERLLPAVMGLEAMGQVFMALVETNTPPVFEQVRFERPVVVSEGTVHQIRVAALVRTPGCVEIVLRSSETSFQVDHFRAVCRVDHAPLDQVQRTIDLNARVAIDPERDLYGRILFHTGRFRRLREYRALKATECAAEIVPDGNVNWFGRYLPGRLVLGDAGARDAAIHAVQACVPQVTLLPVGVEKITGSLNGQTAGLLVHAQERERFADGFVYDVELTDSEGRVRERWERLHLRAVGGTEFKGPWPQGLLTPYVERCLLELIPGADISIVFERDRTSDRRDRSTRALERALGGSSRVIRRADGKPETCDGRNVSASHSGDLTMAVAGHSPAGCDLELVVSRPATIWCDILGAERFKLAEIISHEAQETLDVAATRVWTSVECLKKAGAGNLAPLVFAHAATNGWILLESGEWKIASGVVQTDGAKEDLAIALLTGSENARV